MTRSANTRARLQGFSLMEVMVAVAILGLALTAIFSSEAGAIKAAHRARRTSLASILARCKMNEVEEQVLKEGLPAVDDMGSDGCCVDGEVEGYQCEWEIKRIVLPDDIFANDDDDETGSGLLDKLSGGATKEGSESGPNTASPLGGMLPGAPGAPGGGQDMMGSLLAGGAGDGIAELALQFTYPILKPAFEEQIRRATVRVKWKEGSETKSFDVVQFLVAEQPMKMFGQDEAIGSGTVPGAPGTVGQGTGQAPGAPTGQTPPPGAN